MHSQVFTLTGADTVYRIAIDNINEGVITLSPEGTILYSNHCFARMIGTDVSGVIGHSILGFASPENRETLASMLDQQSRGEVLLQAKDGTPIPTYIAPRRLQTEGLPISAVVSDLSQQKRSEEVIRTGQLVQSILEESPQAVLLRR